MALWYDPFDFEDQLELDHPYDDDVETTIHAWRLLANFYCEKSGELGSDLFEHLSKINCEKELRDQMTRIGKTPIS